VTDLKGPVSVTRRGAVRLETNGSYKRFTDLVGWGSRREGLAKPFEMQSDFSPFLFAAVEKGDLNAVRSLLEGHPGLALSRGAKGTVALHAAATRVNKDIAELLIAKGAEINAADWFGQTPLHYARSEDMVNLLVKHGGTGDIFDEVRIGRLERVKALLKENPDLVFTKGLGFDSGQTPLHVAVRETQKEILEFLLANKADVNANDGNGFSPLYTAFLHHNHARDGDLVQILLAGGADVNAKSQETVLHRAVWAGCKDCIRVLLSAGADINARDRSTNTPLHAAARWGRKDIMEYLLLRGANVNAKNAEGHTPLNCVLEDYGNGICGIPDYGYSLSCVSWQG
jgi:ankyrin repeat protein